MANIKSFLIKDLLKAVKVDNKFVVEGVNFSGLYLCGTISHISQSSHRKRVTYTVDDGTGCINCIIEGDESGDDQRQIDDDLKMMRAEALAAPEDMLVQMALITVQSTKRLIQETCPDGLKPGDNVGIVGNLRQFKDENYIFVDSIRKLSDLKKRIDYLKQILFLYEHVYCIKK